MDPGLEARLGQAEAVLLFDGTCGFCTWCARWVEARDRAGRLLVLPNQAPGVLQRYGFTRAQADRAALVLDRQGRRFVGAAAVNRILRALGPPWRQLATVWAWPPARRVENVGYRLVAANRPLLSALARTRPPYG